MNGSAAGVATAPYRRRPSVASAAPFRPVITGVVPIVRWAILVEHEPNLTKARTERVGDMLAEAWEGWKNDYRDKIAELAGRSSSQLDFQDPAVIYRLDGGTPMIDMPRLSTVEGVWPPLAMRNCSALCTDAMSSKFWTRASLQESGRGSGGCSPDALSASLDRLRNFASGCSEWFHDELYRIAAKAFKGFAHKRVGILEVTTVGLRVQASPAEEAFDDERFDDWLLDGRHPNLKNEQLRSFITAATGVPDPRKLAASESGAYWMSVPTVVQLPSGELAARTTLYLARPVGKVVQVVGIGLDDSASGELAPHAAIKISRVVAGNV